MQWWIEQANTSWQPIERAEDTFEVLLLIRQQLSQSGPSVFFLFCQDHFTNSDDAIAFKEHVLSSAKANAFSTEGNRIGNLVRLVSVGADTKCSVFVRQLHNVVVVLEHFAVSRLHCLANQNLLQFAVGGCDQAVKDFPVEPLMLIASPSFSVTPLHFSVFL